MSAQYPTNKSDITMATNTPLPNSTANFTGNQNTCPTFSNETRQEYANQMAQNQLQMPSQNQQHNIQTSTMDLGFLRDNTPMPETDFNLYNYNLANLFNSGHPLHPIHRKMLIERQRWGWEKWIKYDIKKQLRHLGRLRDVLMKILNIDAEQRDRRDEEAKVLCEGAIRRFMFCKNIAGHWHNLGMQLANISHHQDAMLQRIEDRAINELDSQNDMTSQLFLMLNNYIKACKEYEKAYEKEHSPPGCFSGFLSFFGCVGQNRNMFHMNNNQPNFQGQNMNQNFYGSPQKENNFHRSPINMPEAQNKWVSDPSQNGPMKPPAGSYSTNVLINPHMSNPNFKNNFSNNPNNTSFNQQINRIHHSETQHKARQMQRALNDFIEQFSRYISEIVSKEISAVKYYVKAKADYHSKCLEIYSKLHDNFENIDVEKSVEQMMSGMGMLQIQKDIENKIKMSENTMMNTYNPYVEQQYQQYQNQQSGMMAYNHNQMYGTGGYQGYQQPNQGFAGPRHY